ncbi:MAG: hypothetical protein JOZ53_03030 [Planctomycetaceae bacterium]|nr:hypothetical protein [Planctomycetaceae bacterium]
MAPLLLAPRQRLEVGYLAGHTPAAKERGRAQAPLWRDEGETPEQVAAALRVSRRTTSSRVERSQGRHDLGLGERSSDAPRSGRPRAGGGRVDAWIAEVIDTDPRDLGSHPTAWTAPLLVRDPRNDHGVAVSGTTVARALARLRIRWKRPRHQLARRPETWRQSTGGSNVG